MGISTVFDSEKNVVVMTISGNITVAELVEAYDAIFYHPDFLTNMPAIWDLSALDLKTIPISDIRQLPGELRQYMQKRGLYKAALVTNRRTDFQLLRLYMSILKLIGSNIRIRRFRNLDEAYEWIEAG